MASAVSVWSVNRWLVTYSAVGECCYSLAAKNISFINSEVHSRYKVVRFSLESSFKVVHAWLRPSLRSWADTGVVVLTNVEFCFLALKFLSQCAPVVGATVASDFFLPTLSPGLSALDWVGWVWFLWWFDEDLTKSSTQFQSEFPARNWENISGGEGGSSFTEITNGSIWLLQLSEWTTEPWLREQKRNRFWLQIRTRTFLDVQITNLTTVWTHWVRSRELLNRLLLFDIGRWNAKITSKFTRSWDSWPKLMLWNKRSFMD